MPAHSLKMLIRCGLQIAVMFEEISWEAFCPLAAVLGEWWSTFSQVGKLIRDHHCHEPAFLCGGFLKWGYPQMDGL